MLRTFNNRTSLASIRALARHKQKSRQKAIEIHTIVYLNQLTYTVKGY